MNNTDLLVLHPTFLMHKQWEEGDDFNNTLCELSEQHCLANRYGSSNNPTTPNTPINYLSNKRANMFEDVQHPVMLRFAEMVEAAAREYLANFYQYHYDGDLSLRMQPFLQEGQGKGDNGGVYMHTHQHYDLVVTYYPKVVIADDQEQSPYHRGSLRFYDPSGRGPRRWKNNSPMFQCNSFTVEPKSGSMMVFEGQTPHDSTFFGGVPHVHPGDGDNPERTAVSPDEAHGHQGPIQWTAHPRSMSSTSGRPGS